MSPEADSNDSQVQFRQACAEMQQCLRTGESCQSETLLSKFPALAADPQLSFELVCSEFLFREELGQSPNPAEWYARFPAWKEALKQRFQTRSSPHLVTAGDAVTTPELGAPNGRARSAPSHPAGRQVGRYTLLEELGHGGMGVVYKARDPMLDRVVALKVIRGGLLAGDAEIERFYREARAAARLDHLNIVKIHDIGSHEDTPYYTMDFVAGGSLLKQVQRLGADPRAAAALVEKIARAVQQAHEHGIVHRDLKPGNILLREDGEPCVTDFGLAKFLDTETQLTLPDQALGTPSYMAPEQASIPPRLAGPQTDVWALGVLLYELLTGRRPFEGATAQEVAHRIVTADPPPPRTLRADLDRALDTIVLTCLEKDPRRRYSSAAELADDLRRWLSGEPITSRPSPRWRRSWRAIRRHPGWVAAIGLLSILVCVLGALGFSGVFSRAEPKAEPAVQEFEPLTDLAAKGHLAVGKGTATPLEDDSIHLQSSELALWELPWLHPINRFQLQVEVEDLAPASTGVGVYFGYAKQVTPQGTEHWFYEFSFAERIAAMPEADTMPGQAQSQVRARRQGSGLLKIGTIDHRAAPSPQRYTRGFPPQRGARRLLTVDITPDLVSAYWHQERLPFTLIPQKFFGLNGASLKMQEPAQKVAPPLFHPLRGSLGLLCENGSAIFRGLTIRPLPEKE
jgi:hypothetical protein